MTRLANPHRPHTIPMPGDVLDGWLVRATATCEDVVYCSRANALAAAARFSQPKKPALVFKVRVAVKERVR